MKSLLLGAVLALILVAAAGVSSRSDSTPPALPAPSWSDPEPITDEAVMPLPGAERPGRDPFTPYDVGPPEARWTYGQLTAAEKVVVDRGRDTTGWDRVHGGFRAAVLGHQAEITANAASSQLGIADLDTLGVVP